jgi:hypothetical protein
MLKNSLIDLQQQMMNFLIDGNNNIESKIIEQGKISNQVRLNIYKNAYQVRLKEVIDNDHPLLGQYLGDDLFEEMVSSYLHQHPSNYTSLRHYADQLPHFLASQSPFSEHPIISELAHFERLLLVAFDAGDAERYTLERLQNIAEEQWPILVFHFHPSVQLAHFNWNSVESWQALKTDRVPDPASQKKSTWLLWRNHQRLTEFRSLSEEELHLLKMVLSGENFAGICQQLLSFSNSENVSQLALNYLVSWIEQGLLRAPL